MDLAARIREYIKSHLITFDNQAAFQDGDNIFELGFVDSLFAVELVGFIEKELGFELKNEDLEFSHFTSVDNIVAFLEAKKRR